MRRWIPLILAVALFAGTFLVYLQSLRADFVFWDDNVQLLENSNLGGFSAARIVWAFTDVETAQRYIPLTLLGWIATYQIWELDPFGYHLGNNLLHCGSVVLAYLVLATLFQRFGRSSNGNSTTNWTWAWVCAAIGAALWGWHPMRVEVVAWATTRTYCQATFFLLLFIWLYLRMLTTTRWKTMYALALTTYGCSLLSYPLGLTLPAALLVLDIYPLKRAKFRWAFWKDPALFKCVIEKLPMLAVALIVLVVGLMARSYTAGRYQTKLASLEDFGVLARAVQACYLWMYYAWRPWWPLDFTPVRTELVWFNTVHWWNGNVAPGDWKFFASIVGLVVVTLVLIVVRKRWPLALTLWLVHLIVLLPVLGWTEHPHYPSDRYSMFDGVLWPFAIALLIWRSGLGGRLSARIKGTVGAAVVIGLLVVLTVRQVAVWNNSVTLFRYMIAQLDPQDIYRVDFQRRLGNYYVTLPKPEYELAQQEFQAALRLLPIDERVRLLLANVLRIQKQFDRAEIALRDGLVLNPDSPEIRATLGLTLLDKGRTDEAVEQFNMVLQKHPNNQSAKEGLAAARRAKK